MYSKVQLTIFALECSNTSCSSAFVDPVPDSVSIARPFFGVRIGRIAIMSTAMDGWPVVVWLSRTGSHVIHCYTLECTGGKQPDSARVLASFGDDSSFAVFRAISSGNVFPFRSLNDQSVFAPSHPASVCHPGSLASDAHCRPHWSCGGSQCRGQGKTALSSPLFSRSWR